MGWCGDIIGEKVIVVVGDLGELIILLILGPVADLAFLEFPLGKDDGCLPVDLIELLLYLCIIRGGFVEPGGHHGGRIVGL